MIDMEQTDLRNGLKDIERKDIERCYSSTEKSGWLNHCADTKTIYEKPSKLLQDKALYESQQKKL